MSLLTRKHKRRGAFLAVILIALSAATFLMLRAFSENLLFYFLPSQVKEGKAPARHDFRMGGLVLQGSVKKDGLTVHFTVTDLHDSVPVVYTGILPDLFHEGRGVIVEGRMSGPDLFKADQVLAKHDAKYQPPEMTPEMKKYMQAH
ncbi:MAG: cytochrome c maturation protein CcmE [Alphaproteobacteria bacterium]|nr:cytochrome c maturation protein CcmE [Alphaproteobacteria bacterium]MDE2336765.1 cytochrome c maturation protein CcmE [Alphaproteobacteria bacterium]